MMRQAPAQTAVGRGPFTGVHTMRTLCNADGCHYTPCSLPPKRARHALQLRSPSQWPIHQQQHLHLPQQQQHNMSTHRSLTACIGNPCRAGSTCQTTLPCARRPACAVHRAYTLLCRDCSCCFGVSLATFRQLSLGPAVRVADCHDCHDDTRLPSIPSLLQQRPCPAAR